jgi:peptide/nickel transport system substrate-binding protein
MRKVFIPLVVLLVCAFIITGCNSSTPTPAATTPAVTTSVAPTSSTPAATKPVATTPAISSPAVSSPTIQPPTSPTAPGKQQYGGTLTYVAQTGPGAPIGAPWLSNGTSTLGMQFAEEFFVKEMADASLVPCTMTSYDIVSDPANASITWHLRKGIKFSDGTDFNAAAVKWNLEKSMAVGSTNLGSTTNWKSVEVLDDYTIKINLKTWQNTTPTAFANSVAFCVSPTSFQTKGADWTNYNMVGTGPFIQKNFQRDVVLDFTRNPNYWDTGKPYLDGLTYEFVSDAMTAEALFKSGGGDVLQSYNDMMTSKFKAAGWKVIYSQVGGSTNMWPDSANADSPWSNLKFRQAAEFAIDKDALCKAFGYGNWTPLYQYSGSVSPAYDPNLTPRKFDIAKAKQLLTEAGYPNGVKTSIIVSPFGVNQDLAVAIQAMWKAVGITADLQYPQTGAWSAMLTGSWKNGVLFGPGPGSANPLSGWALTFAPGSAWYQSMKRPDTMADLYKAALAASKLDPALAQKCEDAIYNDSTNIPLWTAPNSWVVTDKVMDTGIGTRGMFAWFEPQNAWLAK